MSIFGKLARVAVDLGVRLPVAVVKDVATLGGAIIDEDSSVVETVKKTARDTEDLVEDIEDL